MNCEQFILNIDAYIDGELSDNELKEMREHAEKCEVCRIEMEKADLLRETLNGIDDDIVVPLEAQAAWRKAVRAEAKQKNVRKWTRALSVVAAALVLALGCTAALNSDMFKNKNATTVDMDVMTTRSALVYEDGTEETTAQNYVEYTAKKTYTVADVNKAIDEMYGLLDEHDAEILELAGNSDNNFYYVKLPADNMEDFFSAMSVIGEETYFELSEMEGELARICIRLVEE